MEYIAMFKRSLETRAQICFVRIFFLVDFMIFMNSQLGM